MPGVPTPSGARLYNVLRGGIWASGNRFKRRCVASCCKEIPSAVWCGTLIRLLALCPRLALAQWDHVLERVPLPCGKVLGFRALWCAPGAGAAPRCAHMLVLAKQDHLRPAERLSPS